MKYLTLVFFLAFIAAQQATAQSVMCYVCTGAECSSDELKYCGPPNETTVPPTNIDTSSPPSETTNSNTDATNESTEVAGTTLGTTFATGETTGPIITTVATGTDTTVAETTLAPGTDTTVAEITTAAPTEKTETPSETTAAETPAAETPAAETTNAPTVEENAVEVLQRSQLLKSVSAAATLIRNYRSAASRADPNPDGYSCYRVSVADDNGTTTVERGCINIPAGENACQVVADQSIGTTSNCKVCQTDGCNGAAKALQISFAALFGILIVKFVM